MALLPLVLILGLSLVAEAVDPSIVAGFNTLGFKQVIKDLPHFQTQGHVGQEKGVHGMAMSLKQKGEFGASAACIAAHKVKESCPFNFEPCDKPVTIALWAMAKPLQGSCGTLFSIGDGHVSFAPGAGKERTVALYIALNDQITSCFCTRKEWESDFLDKWVHMAFVTSPSTLKVYIDGKPFPLDAPKCSQLKQHLADLPDMYIGCRSNAFADSKHGVCGFNGMIDEFQVFEEELSADQVKQLANENRPTK